MLIKSIAVVIAVSFTFLVIASCRDSKIKSSDTEVSKQNVTEKRLQDSVYRLFFGTGRNVDDLMEFDDFRMAGKQKIKVKMFWGKIISESPNKELQCHKGYYYDTVEAGIIHKYQFDGTTAWINSASQIAFTPNADTIKLCGEGYFETADKPLTVLIDTIKFIIDKKSKVEVTAYKTLLDKRTGGWSVTAALVKGAFTVINDTAVDTVKAPNNFVFALSVPENYVLQAWDSASFACWTRLEFDYANMDVNELVRRIGRRYNVPIETMDCCRYPIDFKASLNEPLEKIINRLNTIDSNFNCRLIRGKIVLSSN